MNKKMELLNSYIQRCDEVIQRKDNQQAKTLFLEIMSVYEFEIPNFWSGLQSDIGRSLLDWENMNSSWLIDLPFVKSKLCNYVATVEEKSLSKTPTLVNNNYINTTATSSAYVDFENTIKTTQYTISEMESLSTEETQIALQKLDELITIAKSSDSRKTKWQKIAPIFKWIADKSVELAIAFVPVLMNVVRGL